MPKYLLHGKYSPNGLRGFMDEAGTKRCEAAEKVLASVGGLLEAFYFSFGDNDF